MWFALGQKTLSNMYNVYIFLYVANQKNTVVNTTLRNRSRRFSDKKKPSLKTRKVAAKNKRNSKRQTRKKCGVYSRL